MTTTSAEPNKENVVVLPAEGDSANGKDADSKGAEAATTAASSKASKKASKKPAAKQAAKKAATDKKPAAKKAAAKNEGNVSTKKNAKKAPKAAKKAKVVKKAASKRTRGEAGTKAQTQVPVAWMKQIQARAKQQTTKDDRVTPADVVRNFIAKGLGEKLA